MPLSLAFLIFLKKGKKPMEWVGVNKGEEEIVVENLEGSFLFYNSVIFIGWFYGVLSSVAFLSE